VVVEFELKALQLLDMCSTTWTKPPALVTSAIFWIESCLYAWVGLDHFSLYLYVPHSWDYRCTPVHPAFLLVEMWILLTFCLGWLGTTTLLISASWVVRITGVSYWAWLWPPFLFLPGTLNMLGVDLNKLIHVKTMPGPKQHWRIFIAMALS
jgi:hypothetical protein